MKKVEFQDVLQRTIRFESFIDEEELEGRYTLACQSISSKFFDEAHLHSGLFIIRAENKDVLEEKTFELISEITRLQKNRIYSDYNGEIEETGINMSPSEFKRSEVGNSYVLWTDENDEDENELEYAIFFEDHSKFVESIKNDEEEMQNFLDDFPLNPKSSDFDIEGDVYGDIHVFTKQDASMFFKFEE
ncbi:MAG: hypothetical protein CL760_09020 [Chloroflexi bacterium]|nr:hypothetical protein [Chloroflexota bacterium]|tara:strand:- start:43815 stop:44381 length:567 start_codon:yes stop_codon:yes gene_type:complete